MRLHVHQITWMSLGTALCSVMYYMLAELQCYCRTGAI